MGRLRFIYFLLSVIFIPNFLFSQIDIVNTSLTDSSIRILYQYRENNLKAINLPSEIRNDVEIYSSLSKSSISSFDSSYFYMNPGYFSHFPVFDTLIVRQKSTSKVLYSRVFEVLESKRVKILPLLGNNYRDSLLIDTVFSDMKLIEENPTIKMAYFDLTPVMLGDSVVGYLQNISNLRYPEILKSDLKLVSLIIKLYDLKGNLLKSYNPLPSEKQIYSYAYRGKCDDLYLPNNEYRLTNNQLKKIKKMSISGEIIKIEKIIALSGSVLSLWESICIKILPL